MTAPDMESELRTVGQALGLVLADEQIETLLAYLSMLERWNSTYNLTAIRIPGEMLTQHLADCLAVVDPLRRHLGSKRARVLDVGSGGGLPGVVLAVMLPGVSVTCIDSVGKKAAFVRQVAAELRLGNLCSEQVRVEISSASMFDVITSRAFAALGQFFRLTRGRLAADGCWLAMKARLQDVELASVGSDVDVFHVEPLVVPGLHADRCLVWARPRRPPGPNQ